MTKNIYSVPAGVPFLDALAEGLWHEAGGDTFKLADSLILLPTRRACRHLREAFLRHMDAKAALLPRMQPLGDIDEEEFYFNDDINPDIPPAITPLRRHMLLTQLIRAQDQEIPLDQAAQLAEALARFLDQVQIERCDLSKLDQLVEEKDLAAHWQETVKFLRILTENWPAILKAEGCIDPADRRNRVLELQSAAWRAKPPAFPVVAAGSTGTMPATAELLAVIAGLPQGKVILPGLDQALPEDAWQSVTATHPQFAMKQLLEKCGVERNKVKQWSAELDEQKHTNSSPLAGEVGRGGSTQSQTSILLNAPSPNPSREGRGIPVSLAGRAALLRESMRPAEVTDEWRHLKAKDIPREALNGLTRLDLDHPQEEAQAIALLMRASLETSKKTTALVTADRTLAERVSGMLARWGIEANDSAGAPLTSQPIGSFLIDLLSVAAPQAGAVDYLSLLKHPYAACGLSPAECRAKARELEIAVWRSEKPEHSDWLDELRQQFQPLTKNWKKTLPFLERLKTHLALAEQIATSDQEKGADRLWKDEAGEKTADWLVDLQAAAGQFPALKGEEYAALFAELLRLVTVRPSYGQHPRLSILGPLEARLIQPDLVILGGLNEGSWPPEPPIDPWMSRPMKIKFGLPSPERRIGLSAHDFVQLASAPEVVLTRAKRAGNAPTVPSRFLLQLDAVLHAVGHPEDVLAPSDPWQDWARLLDEPAHIKPCDAPEPKPAKEVRPMQLSVTEIGTWRRNPYAIYAKHILKLKKLDPLEAEIDASDRGTLIHAALDEFIKKHPKDLPANAVEELCAIGEKIFATYDEHSEVKAFWWPRFERIAFWFADKERTRRAEGTQVLQAEARGTTAINGFTLKGRADRIDRLADGTLAITDYKTGGLPTQKEIEKGYEPQLPLLGYMAGQGAFEGVKPAALGELAHWKLSGGREIAETQSIKNPDKLAEEARAGLEALITKFADPATPYQAVPKPRLQPRYDDYAHLARLAEWGRTGEGE